MALASASDCANFRPGTLGERIAARLSLLAAVSFVFFLHAHCDCCDCGGGQNGSGFLLALEAGLAVLTAATVFAPAIRDALGGLAARAAGRVALALSPATTAIPRLLRLLALAAARAVVSVRMVEASVMARRVAARLRACLGAITPMILPRLATTMVAGFAAHSAA